MLGVGVVADGVFNVAKGSVAAYHNRVNDGDPSTSRLVIVGLASAGLVTDATMKDYATLAAVFAGTSDECTNTNYVRKILTSADIAGTTVDNTNDWVTADTADQTWAAVVNDGTLAWGKLLFCYDPVAGSGTDSEIIPLTYHDFAVTPNGGSITATVSDYFKAT